MDKTLSPDETPNVSGDQMMVTMMNAYMAFVKELIECAERMHTASLETTQSMLDSALKGAKDIDPENFSIIVNAVQVTSAAAIQAEQTVALARIEGAVSNFDGLYRTCGKAIEAFAPLAAQQAQANRDRSTARSMEAEARRMEAEARKMEAEAKLENSQTERLKAKTAARANGGGAPFQA